MFGNSFSYWFCWCKKIAWVSLSRLRVLAVIFTLSLHIDSKILKEMSCWLRFGITPVGQPRACWVQSVAASQAFVYVFCHLVKKGWTGGILQSSWNIFCRQEYFVLFIAENVLNKFRMFSPYYSSKEKQFCLGSDNVLLQLTFPHDSSSRSRWMARLHLC